MTTIQSVLTIAAVAAGTMLTRFLPFILFPEGKTPPACITSKKQAPEYIRYLGRALPSAIFGMLVIYCLKDSFSNGSYAFPEVTAGIFTIMLHKWRKNTLLSIGAGTVLYMFLIQNYF